ncbi:protein NYNRIN-like [Epinephelus lanceolatus]
MPRFAFPRFVLTQARHTGYEVILSAPELNIQRCTVINPATKLILPTEGTLHDCIHDTEKFTRAREDLHNQPIPADLTLFVDGSCFRDATGSHADYGIVQLKNDDHTFDTLQAHKLAQPCSAQLAEIKALTEACKLAAGKSLNIYTDSAYAYGVCHVHANIWKQRGFRRADGTPVTHGAAILALLETMLLPTALAVIKCPAQQKTNTLIATGNNLADEAAKQAAIGAVMAPILTIQDCEPLTSLPSLIAAQDRVDEAEKRLWVKRGAIKNTQTGPIRGPLYGVWLDAHGRFVLPTLLLRHAIIWAHGSDHCARGEILRKLQAVWWSPFMAATVDRVLNECDVCAEYNIRKVFSAPLAHIPPPDGPFRHLMLDYIDMGLQSRVKGLRYVLVVICRYSRWVEAKATAKSDHKTVAKFLCQEVFPRFEMSDTISSDNGSHFVSNVMQETLKQLGIKQKFGCVYHPQSQGAVERANGILKTKIAKIVADSRNKLNWVDALPLALMSMRSQASRVTHLTPHEMLTGRPMPLPYLRDPHEGPSLEQLQGEMFEYLRSLTRIHRAVFQQVKGATEDRGVDIPADLQRIRPGEQVYVKVFKRKWDQPQREGPYKVILATPTALKVEGKDVWFHLNHCCRANTPERPPVPRPRARQRAVTPEPQGDGEAAPRAIRDQPEGDGDASPQEQGTRRSARVAQRRRAQRAQSDSSGSAQSESSGSLPERVSTGAESSSEGGSSSPGTDSQPRSHESSPTSDRTNHEGTSTEREVAAEAKGPEGVGAETEGEERVESLSSETGKARDPERSDSNSGSSSDSDSNSRDTDTRDPDPGEGTAPRQT